MLWESLAEFSAMWQSVEQVFALAGRMRFLLCDQASPLGHTSRALGRVDSWVELSHRLHRYDNYQIR